MRKILPEFYYAASMRRVSMGLIALLFYFALFFFAAMTIGTALGYVADHFSFLNIPLLILYYAFVAVLVLRGIWGFSVFVLIKAKKMKA